MTTYTAIPNGDVDADSPITTTLITQLRDNPIAITEGASGAPQIQTAAIANDAITAAKIATNAVGASEIAAGAVGASEIAAGAVGTSEIATDGVAQAEIAANVVGQSEIKTTYQAVASDQNFAFSGGVYMLGWQHQRSNSGGAKTLNFISNTGADSTSFTSYLTYDEGISGTPGSSYDEMRLHYINASPPYDLGDGDCPMFVFLRIQNGTGEILSMSRSVDPPWAYNGPTDCTPHRYGKDGKSYQTRKDMSGLTRTLEEAKILGATAISEYFDEYRLAPTFEIEVDQAMKRADMELIPHANPEEAGVTLVMLDPMSDIMQTFLELHNYAEYEQGSEISNIVRNYITIGNSNIGRRGPSSIIIPSVAWRNNGARGQPT